METQLKKGANGLFAVCDGKIVAYGWLNKKGSLDLFYSFKDNTAYLSSFYVDESFRGNGIYPAMLSHFILEHQEYSKFYISVYTSNASSRNGLLKVGFKLERTLKFIRAFKITLNKYRIK